MRNFLAIFTLLLITQILLSANQCTSEQEKNMIEEIAAQQWVHSHEDDKDGMKAYRPSTYKFPPSRGREGFSLKKEGSFTYHAIARADGNEKVAGTWKLLEGQSIEIMLSNDQAFKFSFKEISEDGVLFLTKEYL